MDPSTLLFVVVALAGFVAVGGLGLAFAGGGGGAGGARVAKRVASVGTSRAEARLKAKTPGDAAGQRRKQIIENLKTIERQERRAKLTLKARIQQAGLTISVPTFWAGGLAFGGMAGALLMMSTHMALAALGLAFVAGVGLPRWVLGMLCASRMKKFTEEFPNAVDVIVRGIKSGLPVHDCLRVIATESPQPLAEEFRRLVEQLGMGQDVASSLDKMYARMPTQEVRYFSIVLAIQQKTGGNLAEALSNLSTVLRARKLMREKIKALSGEAVASAYIIGSLPPGIVALVSVTSPPYMAPMFSDPRGHIALMIGAVIMGAGAFIMRRMINFKF